MSLGAAIQITDQDTRAVAASKGGERLGQLAATPDGRLYRYSQSGAVALAAGKLLSASAVVANHINRTGTTSVAGTNQVTFTLGATLATADQYADGYFVVNAGTGAGQTLSVVGNNAAISGGSIVVNLYEGLFTATLAADSKFSLYAHQNSGTIITASAASAALQAVGVPNVAVAAASYFWAQVGGYCSTLANGTIAKGAGTIIGSTTDGSVDTEAAATVTQRVGFMPEASVTTEYRPVYLTIN